MKVLLISYNNEDYIHYFPLGLAYVASAMRENGHDVEVYSQDVYRYTEAHLTDYLTRNDFDVVGTGMCAGYYQFDRLKKLSKACEKAGRKLTVGGHMVSPFPEEFEELLNIDVIAGEYGHKGDLNDVPYPAWDLFHINYYSLIRLPLSSNTDRCMPVLSGRGCPFRCNFCYRMEKGHRTRSVSGIVKEINELRDRYRINYIDFADELLMINPDRPIEISEALKPLGIKWMCNGRLNYAKPKVLKKMKEAGCVFINYGIECFDDQVLLNMNKNLTEKQIISGVGATLKAGISPGLNMIWGNIGDTVNTLWKSVEFLLKYDDHTQMRTIRPVTPYPGCDLYKKAVKEGKIKDVADFYGMHKNSDLASVQFTELGNDEFHRHLCGANKTLLAEYYKDKLTQSYGIVDKLYSGNADFRGFRQT